MPAKGGARQYTGNHTTTRQTNGTARGHYSRAASGTSTASISTKTRNGTTTHGHDIEYDESTTHGSTNNRTHKTRVSNISQTLAPIVTDLYKQKHRGSSTGNGSSHGSHGSHAFANGINKTLTTTTTTNGTTVTVTGTASTLSNGIVSNHQVSKSVSHHTTNSNGIHSKHNGNSKAGNRSVTVRSRKHGSRSRYIESKPICEQSPNLDLALVPQDLRSARENDAVILKNHIVGLLKYIGTFIGDLNSRSYYMGLECVDKIPKNRSDLTDGKFKDKRYFRTANNSRTGIFVKLDQFQQILRPPHLLQHMKKLMICVEDLKQSVKQRYKMIIFLFLFLFFCCCCFVLLLAARYNLVLWYECEESINECTVCQ